MSVGNLKTDGQKGNNFPWQLKMLQGIQGIIDALTVGTCCPPQLKYPNIENIPYKAVKPATMDLLGNHIGAVIIGSSTDIVSPLSILANSTDQKINNIPTFSECLGINISITADFLLITNKNSSVKFAESMELLVTEFLQDKDTQTYYTENLMYSNSVGLKKINSTILSQLKRWKELEK
jgi:tripartite-type tricarboxylate transporter receptor subunit TctC